MRLSSTLNLVSIAKAYKAQIGITWFLVILENLFMALVPLFIGYSIDSLLQGQFTDLFILAGILVLVIVVAVLRRLYDTRIYGTIRVDLGIAVDKRLQSYPLTTRNARLDMSRELVDFMEQDLPPLMTAVIQIAASIVILATFDYRLAASAAMAAILMLAVYGVFHQSFIRLNGALNNQKERQITVLNHLKVSRLASHLERLRRREIQLSDTEAITYGLIFFVLFGFVIINLWLATHLVSVSAGTIFSIVTYSFEYMEASVMLPVTLQTLSRLTEITQRINSGSFDKGLSAEGAPNEQN